MKKLAYLLLFFVLVGCSSDQENREAEASSEAMPTSSTPEPIPEPTPEATPEATPESTPEPDLFGPAEVIRTNVFTECTEGTFECGFDVRLSRPPSEPVSIIITEIGGTDGDDCFTETIGMTVAVLQVGETIQETNWDVGQGVGFTTIDDDQFHDGGWGRACSVTFTAKGAAEFETLDSFTYYFSVYDTEDPTPTDTSSITEPWDLALHEAGCALQTDWRPFYWDCEAIDLTGIDLRNANLANVMFGGAVLNNADLRNANIWEAEFSSAELIGIDLSYAVINKADFFGANLTDAFLEGSVLNDVIFYYSELPGVDLNGSQGENTSFWGSNLRGANFSSASFPQGFFEVADLSGANLSDTLLTDGSFTHAGFEGADLTNANFSRSILQGVGLNNANLTNTIFIDAVMSSACDTCGSAKLTEATIQNTNFTNADLIGVDLTGLDLSTAVLDGATFE